MDAELCSCMAPGAAAVLPDTVVSVQLSPVQRLSTRVSAAIH